ncbi:PP0621 family protein [Pseudomonas sp. ML96]|uniref:PP0621 family protein n=1 Tax=Pseudomonas sp. ML96 TaxID=1523503 RepID=UPI0005BD8C83|nr:PP0621 family protein [Pseudomonas sp. ML96]
MFRLLFWIALIAAAVWLWRRFNRPARPTPSATQEHEAAPMVRCAQCGVHVPQDKALPQGAQWYCSQAHLDQHQQ